MINQKNYNLPKPLKRSDYEWCVEQVKKDVSDNPSVRSAYLMGGPWCPGISDLDIVVVYKDGPIGNPVRSLWGRSEVSDFILTHRYLSFFEKDFKNFYYLYPKNTAQLRLLWGEDLAIENPSDVFSGTDAKMVMASILFDIFINKLLLFPRFQLENLNVRQVIGELYSLTYTFSILKDLTGLELGSEFVGEISDLRRQWFERGEDENLNRLTKLVSGGLEEVGRAVVIFDNWLGSVNVENDPTIKFSNRTYAISCVQSWEREVFLKVFRANYINTTLPFFGRKIEHFTLVLPKNFSYFFLNYAASEGEFGAGFRRYLSAKVAFSGKSAGVERRIQLINNIFKASVDSGGLIKRPFAFGLPVCQNRLKDTLVKFYLLSLKCFLKQK